MSKQKKWYDYLWIFSSVYLVLGFFNIMFAWIGLICFITPLALSLMGKGKVYCNRYCGRGQLFQLLGEKYKLSRNKPIPAWMRSNVWRYAFLVWFLSMFGVMLFKTYLVFTGVNSLKEVVTILWTFKVPWSFASATNSNIPLWMQQFGYGFYSVMLTSTILGLITMLLYKPRSWCVYCPMGTMTQTICKLRK
ncbi:MAG: 4Fe-4S binding protein [Erysipelotrichales bacterium]|nr:4Fe-4S binding protein [Erysipelotrichales bacterium]